MADSDSEKTEEATQARRDDFRKRGQVAHSKELASALILISAATMAVVLGRFFLKELFEVFNYALGPDMVSAIRSGDLFSAAKFASLKFTVLVLPVLGISLLLGIGSSILQTGFLTVEDALSPKFDKINPLEGLKRVFSLRNVAESIKALLKLSFIAFLTYLILKGEFHQIPYLSQYSIQEMLTYMGRVLFKLLFGIGMAMTVLTVADYFYQRWDLNQKMMMTKQEVKEEHKSREGDPMIRARIRRIQREMSNRRMMDKIPKADVIITNPTHIAVALKYDQNLPAPQLVAKGADLIAEKIKEIARTHNIPIIENKPLARTIYKTMKLGQVIPKELFVAVAEVLSYVYRLRKRAGR